MAGRTRTVYKPNKNFKDGVRKEVVKRLQEALFHLERETKKNLSGQGSGRVYEISSEESDGTVLHQASAPGEYPAVQFGNLRASIETVMDEVREKGYIGTNVEYGLDLELKPPREGGRPWLMKSVRENQDLVTKSLDE